jgi:hypothetical protein
MVRHRLNQGLLFQQLLYKQEMMLNIPGVAMFVVGVIHSGQSRDILHKKRSITGYLG